MASDSPMMPPPMTMTSQDFTASFYRSRGNVLAFEVDATARYSI
jgi:hypothetical protein